jgi:elongation factor P
MQALYSDGESWHFMDTRSYEQMAITMDDLGDAAQWLKENTNVQVLLWNERPIGVDVPNHVDLKITYCEPGVRGDTATGATKPATLETGAVVQVPLFVEEGEVIRVDTRTSEYISRVGK